MTTPTVTGPAPGHRPALGAAARWAPPCWRCMGWIHLDLWLAGYRTIDVIGPAFLLNAIAGFGLAVLLLVTPRPLLRLGGRTRRPHRARHARRPAARDHGRALRLRRSPPRPDLWWESFWVEIAAVVVLAALAALAARRRD